MIANVFEETSFARDPRATLVYEVPELAARRAMIPDEVLPDEALPDEAATPEAIAQAAREARQRKRQGLSKAKFSVGRHVAAFVALSVAALTVAFFLMAQATWSELWRHLWIVPAYFVLANAVEWFMHRYPMHRPGWPRVLYRNHTLGHHRAFHHDSMAIDNWRELELVMMPWFTILLFSGAATPVAVALGHFLGTGAAGLFLFTATSTFLLFEVMHATYHLPLPVLQRTGLLRFAPYRFVYEHHRHHHRLVRMRFVNFNISVPLSDLLTGTLETETTWQSRPRRPR